MRWLRVHGHKDIVETLDSLPIIHADATLPLDLVRNYLPNLKLACDLDVEAPHMRVTQVVGMPVGKSALEPKPPGKRKGKQRGAWTETAEEAEERVARKRQRLVDACRHLHRAGADWSSPTRTSRTDFAGIEGVEVAHFGAIEGIDRWRDVDVAGDHRPAAAQAGRHRADGGRHHRQAVIAGGSVKQTGRSAPAATIIELPGLRRAGGRNGPAGRHRGGHRAGRRARAGRQPDGSNPVEVYLILDDTVVPGVPVDEVVELADIEPDAIDQMIARGTGAADADRRGQALPGPVPVEEHCKTSIPSRPGCGRNEARRAEVGDIAL